MSSSIDAILELIEAIWGGRLTEPARRDIAARLTRAIGNARVFAGLDILSTAAREKEIEALARAAEKQKVRSPGWWPEDIKRPSDDTIMSLDFSIEDKDWDNMDTRKLIAEKAISCSRKYQSRLEHDPSRLHIRRRGRPRDMVKLDLGAVIYDLILMLNETSILFEVHSSPMRVVPTCTPNGPYVRLMKECFGAAGLSPRNAKAIAAEIIAQNDPEGAEHAERRDEREQERRRTMRRRTNSDK
jgi:hypothetical protein